MIMTKVFCALELLVTNPRRLPRILCSQTIRAFIRCPWTSDTVVIDKATFPTTRHFGEHVSSQPMECSSTFTQVVVAKLTGQWLSARFSCIQRWVVRSGIIHAVDEMVVIFLTEAFVLRPATETRVIVAEPSGNVYKSCLGLHCSIPYGICPVTIDETIPSPSSSIAIEVVECFPLVTIAADLSIGHANMEDKRQTGLRFLNLGSVMLACEQTSRLQLYSQISYSRTSVNLLSFLDLGGTLSLPKIELLGNPCRMAETRSSKGWAFGTIQKLSLGGTGGLSGAAKSS